MMATNKNFSLLLKIILLIILAQQHSPSIILNLLDNSQHVSLYVYPMNVDFIKEYLFSQ